MKAKPVPICEYLSRLLSQDLSSLSAVTRTQVQTVISALNKPELDDAHLRQLAFFQGLPHAPAVKGLRMIVWRLLLGVLSPKPDTWGKEILERKKLYESYKEKELTFESYTDSHVGYHTPSGVREKLFYILSLDATRTFLDPALCDIKTACDAMIRAIGIYCIMYNGAEYTCGMSFPFATLYLTLRLDGLPGDEDFAESESFFCFVALMKHHKSRFDFIPAGIPLALAEDFATIDGILQRFDPPVRNKLHAENVTYEMFGYSRLVTLFSREYAFPDTQRLFDVVLAECQTCKVARYMVAAEVRCLREQILAGSMIDIVTVLNRPNDHVLAERLKELATEMYKKDGNKF